MASASGSNDESSDQDHEAEERREERLGWQLRREYRSGQPTRQRLQLRGFGDHQEGGDGGHNGDRDGQRHRRKVGRPAQGLPLHADRACHGRGPWPGQPPPEDAEERRTRSC